MLLEGKGVTHRANIPLLTVEKRQSIVYVSIGHSDFTDDEAAIKHQQCWTHVELDLYLLVVFHLSTCSTQ
jgi:hypothetical protein